MRGPSVIAAVALVSSCGSATSTSTSSPGSARRAPLTAKDIVQRSSPAIVRIEAGGDKVGTGFILDKAGLVATNLHVVAGESVIRVQLHDGTEYPVMRIAGLDADRDLALLWIAPTRELPIVKLGDSDAMAAGDQIVTIGNPLGVFDHSVTAGLISQVRPVCRPQDIVARRCEHELTILQISAAISPGSSGGPLFNLFGEVVGITTLTTPGQNLNIAVPGNYLKPLVARRATISLEQFAKDTTQDGPPGAEADSNVRIDRRIPRHAVTVFDGCRADDIDDLVRQIGEAIESGAPLYNQGKHEACFRIYEGTAVKFERDAPCAGIRTAFGDGLLRASGLSSYTEKAWAMRDAFDGLLRAAKQWRDQHPPGAPPGGKAQPAPRT